MKNVWTELKKPIFALAPMDGVTDTVFRQVIAEIGKPDLFFTEFANVEGLNSKGAEEVKKRLIFESSEKPIIAQIWGTNPIHFYESARLVREMGFDGVDINMGCPDRSIVRSGACSGLIDNEELAEKIIAETKKGAGELPVSVKTRIGVRTIETDRWISFLLKQGLDAITIHGRTSKEMSKAAVHWDEIEKAVKLRDKISPTTIILGNGDVLSIAEAKELIFKHGVDGIMFGRAIFHNPWLFNEDKNIDTIKTEDKISLLRAHLDLYDTTWGESKSFDILKKYFKIYVNGFENASEFRQRLMDTKKVEDAKKVIEEFNY